MVALMEYHASQLKEAAPVITSSLTFIINFSISCIFPDDCKVAKGSKILIIIDLYRFCRREDY